MSIRFHSHADDFGRKLAARTLRGLRETSGTLFDLARDAINTGYPRASRPGEYLRRRSGDGRRSITFFRSTRKPRAGELGYVTGTSSDRLVEQGRARFNYIAHWERSARSDRRRPLFTQLYKIHRHPLAQQFIRAFRAGGGP